VSDLYRTISSDPDLSNPYKFVIRICDDLKNSKELTLALIKRDIKAQYRQSFLGYIWAILPPLFTTITFSILNASNIINVSNLPIAYPAFAMIGSLLWQFFVDSLNAPINSITANASMMNQVNFPREALIFAGLGNVIFNFIIRLFLLIPVFLLFDINLKWEIIYSLIGISSIFLLGTATGLLLAPLSMLYSDIQRLLALFMGFWMLLSPVVYPPNQSNIFLKLLSEINPIAPLLTSTRNWIISEPQIISGSFFLVIIVSLFALIGSWFIYRLALPHLIARVS